jgi:hypothetical protein
MALKQYGERYPVGQRQLQMVDELLAYTADPDTEAKRRLALLSLTG